MTSVETASAREIQKESFRLFSRLPAAFQLSVGGSAVLELTIVFLLRTSAILEQAQMALGLASVDYRLPPSHLGSVHASRTLLSIWRRLTIVFLLRTSAILEQAQMALGLASVDYRLPPSHLGSVHASMTLRSVWRRLGCTASRSGRPWRPQGACAWSGDVKC